jgi:membrane-bound serine protease (ClpP class)
MRAIIFSLLLLSFVTLTPRTQARDEIRNGTVVVVPINGEVSPPMFLFLRRILKAAESKGAAAIIFEMNTYGGRLDSAEEITNLLNHATIPTYTYINTNAGSAGALIALATQHIYMAPVSAIGAAAPILASGEDLGATARDKTISYWSALVRGSANRNGHNPDVGEAFMDKNKEVKIGERVVHPKGTLLTLSAQEAAAQIDGKPLLAEGIVDSVAELVRKGELKGEVVSVKPAGFEQLAFWITALAPLLLLGGMLFAYLEFKIPGASLPGVLSLFSFWATISPGWPAGKSSRFLFSASFL